MSVIITTCQQISNNPLNTSTSKQLFSFGKEERFKSSAKLNCNAFYNLPPVLAKRTTSLGYGKKYDFTKLCNQNPGPNAYQSVEIQGSKKSKRAGFTIGLGREEIKFCSFNSQMKGQKNPGPGGYDIHLTQSKYKFISIKSRPKDPKSITHQVPGPGFYKVPSCISKDGKYALSTYKSSGAPSISKSSSERFVYRCSNTPGPQAYNQEIPEKNGIIRLSKYTSPGIRSFGHEGRKNKSTAALVPGPGSYVIPSDFGQYQAKNVPQTEKSVLPPVNTKKAEKEVDKTEKNQIKVIDYK